ncbi:MAG: DMT family transporter [Candidatus Atribacteria bacterium]|nr:DMT family transporter [Candidatus Atribacteria bacterium]
MDNKEKEGIILVIICVFIHGSQPILGKYGVSLVPPLFFASLTNLIAAVFLILLILARRENIFLLLKARYFLILLSIGFFGTTLSNILFFYGVRLTSGINSAILLQIEPLYALLIGYLLLKERINSRQIIATLFIILGTILVVYQGTSKLNWGDILVLLTPLCYQISHFFSKKLLNKTDLSPLFIATGRTLYGGIFLFLLSQLAGIHEWSILAKHNMLSLFIFYGIVVYALSYLTFYEAIKRINLSKASAIISVYPAISILLAWFILREVPDVYQLTGFFIILLGIFRLSQVQSELRI